MGFFASVEEMTPALLARDYKDPPIVSPTAEYLVRRLTPDECCRLQGYPDGWCAGLDSEAPTEAEVSRWREIFAVWDVVQGRADREPTIRSSNGCGTRIGKLREAIEQAKQEGVPKWGGKIPPNLKLPLRDGDVDRPDDLAYADSYFINATSQEKPGIVDRRRIPLTDPLSIYSGCYIRASVNLYPFNANGNRGIAAGLSNIQFWENGEPLNGRVRAEDEFDSLDAEDDEDFLD